MLRKERMRKKQIKRAGWQILEQNQSPENMQVMVLQKVGTQEQRRVEASSLARVYQQAEVAVGAHRR